MVRQRKPSLLAPPFLRLLHLDPQPLVCKLLRPLQHACISLIFMNSSITVLGTAGQGTPVRQSDSPRPRVPPPPPPPPPPPSLPPRLQHASSSEIGRTLVPVPAARCVCATTFPSFVIMACSVLLLLTCVTQEWYTKRGWSAGIRHTARC